MSACWAVVTGGWATVGGWGCNCTCLCIVPQVKYSTLTNPPSSAAVAVVMESTTGGILLKSALRVLGTALAGLLGVG